jgi:hypothetical protein
MIELMNRPQTILRSKGPEIKTGHIERKELATPVIHRLYIYSNFLTCSIGINPSNNSSLLIMAIVIVRLQTPFFKEFTVIQSLSLLNNFPSYNFRTTFLIIRIVCHLDPLFEILRSNFVSKTHKCLRIGCVVGRRIHFWSLISW